MTMKNKLQLFFIKVPETSKLHSDMDATRGLCTSLAKKKEDKTLN